MNKLLHITSPQYGEAHNTVESSEFVAYELLQYGSCMINFIDHSNSTLPILIAYPRALFVKERYLYMYMGNQDMMVIPIDTIDNATQIENTVHTLPIDINKQDLIEFLQGIIATIRSV